MQAIDATFDEISFEPERDPRKPLPQILLLSAALALVGGLGAVVLHGLNARQPTAPAVAAARPALTSASNPFGAIIIDPSFVAKTKPAAPATEAAPNPFGAIIVDPSFVAEMKRAPPAQNLASLEAVPRAPASEAAPPSTAAALPEAVPLPPKRDVPQIVDSAPLPPPRPAEFASLGAPASPDRRVGELSGAPAPADNRNVFQKLFGLGLPSGPAVKSAPAAPYRTAALPSTPPPSPLASIMSAPSAAPEGRWVRGLFAGFTPTTDFDRLGYDHYTAVYDNSARTVYLPDGTRLEAHSGYGDRLDDPRYVSERMYGPTPPNVYELTPREASFHGVEALRLNPIGDSPLYGRAGLLAHPYMLGPNGDSNGCVSFKDYEAFLRAYRNGQIKRLVVVARI